VGDDDVAVTVLGRGPRVVLVHGSIGDGREPWARQLPLARRWRLVVPDRRGYGASTHLADGQDCVADAADIVKLLGRGAHLVGHSYGAMGAALAAARRPDRIRSLVLIEPPCMALRRGDPAVEAFVGGMEALVSRAPTTDEFLDGFSALAGIPRPRPRGARERERLERAVATQLRGRWPWTVELPVAELRDLAAPKLVVSGGHSPLFEALSDDLAARIDARRAIVPGSGHAVPFAGRPFNEVLEAFWS
jgi:pimeloyl-ACP methyl ester carboxylesterase